MSRASERRRNSRQKPSNEAGPAWVVLQNVPGRSGDVRAKLVDRSDLGIGVQVPFWLRNDETLTINGLGGAGETNGAVRARVVRCAESDGGYLAGLAFEQAFDASDTKTVTFLDFYELLQISPNADPDMIHRVFRLLAQRYHPDNTVTGDENTFRAIADAYKVLSDPEKRAAYDIQLQAQRQQRWQIFDQKQASVGKLAEKAKRKGILELLYTVRKNQPTNPTLNLHELEHMLGCPREHLEFSLWYLKENGLLLKGDSGRFTITAKGVEWTEDQEVAEEVAKDHLLTAGNAAKS
jgi:DnaJ domain